MLHLCARLMSEFHLVLSHPRSPTGHFARCRIIHPLERGTIGVNGEGAATEVVVKLLEGPDDGEGFFFMGGPTAGDLSKCLGGELNRAPRLVVGGAAGKNGTEGEG